MEQEVSKATPDMKSLEEMRTEESQPYPAPRYGLQHLTAVKCIFNQQLVVAVMGFSGISPIPFEPCLSSWPQQLPAVMNPAVELNTARKSTSSDQV